MGTKSRHIKSLTAIILATILLTGCDGGGGGGSGGEGGSGSTPEVPPPDTGGGTPNPEPPEPNPPEVTSKTGYLLMGAPRQLPGLIVIMSLATVLLLYLEIQLPAG